MTDPSTLHVETRRLAEYGRERYEDSVVYQAVTHGNIGNLIRAMTEYFDKVNAAFSACANPEKSFLDVVDDFIGALSQAEAAHVGALAELIKIDEQVRRERPDIGSRGHDVTPFPRQDIGADAWSDPDGWIPAPNRPAI
jgi:hypothetical protein